MRLSSVFAGLLAALCAGSARAGSLGPLRDPAWGGDGNGIARIAFDIAGLHRDQATAAIRLADGRLVLAGDAETGPSSPEAAFVRLDAHSGLPDPSFGPAHDGRALAGVALSSVDDIVAAADGSLYFAGWAEAGADASAMIGRLLADGMPDPSFGSGGHRLISADIFTEGARVVGFYHVLVLPDERVLAFGYASAVTADGGDIYLGCVMRFHADGSTDTSFADGAGIVCVAPATSANPSFLAADGLRLDDGHLLLAGAAMHPGGSGYDMSVLRMSADGVPDATFGTTHDGWAYVAFDEGQSPQDFALAVAVDANERIVLAGTFDNRDSQDIGIARLDADGAADFSFGVEGRVQIALDIAGYDAAHSVALRNDGGILIGARSLVEPKVGVAILLHTDGMLDARFGKHGVFVQADPLGSEAGIFDSRRQLVSGDDLYMIGSLDALPLHRVPAVRYVATARTAAGRTTSRRRASCCRCSAAASRSRPLSAGNARLDSAAPRGARIDASAQACRLFSGRRCADSAHIPCVSDDRLPVMDRYRTMDAEHETSLRWHKPPARRVSLRKRYRVHRMNSCVPHLFSGPC